MAWYGLANCLSGDSVVIRDPSSPTGWGFRSSYYRATKAYQRAFQLLPSIHKALSVGSFAAVRHLLWTSGSTLRFGYPLPPDTTTLVAYPTWQGDSLAFHPLPLSRLARSGRVPLGLGLAVQHEHQLFHDIATAWVSAFPRSAESMEALALSLELLGNSAALDTIRRARVLATTLEERLRLAMAQAWMLVKFSIPSDTAGLRAARLLADSVLPQGMTARVQQPTLLASLAALTGRAQLAATLSRQPAFVEEWEVPAPIQENAGPLLAYAALGGPVDSLRDLEQRIDDAINEQITGSAQHEAQMQWLGRAVAVGFPHYRFGSLEKLQGQGNYLVDIEAAFVRGDTSRTRRMLSDVEAARRSALASDLTFDALYPEAFLLESLGDPRRAIAWLDPTLRTLSASAPRKFADPANAGALVQAMALRADLAEASGDHQTAARWAGAVSMLWQGADPFLQPVVRRMERLAGGAPGVR